MNIFSSSARSASNVGPAGTSEAVPVDQFPGGRMVSEVGPSLLLRAAPPKQQMSLGAARVKKQGEANEDDAFTTFRGLAAINGGGRGNGEFLCCLICCRYTTPCGCCDNLCDKICKKICGEFCDDPDDI